MPKVTQVAWGRAGNQVQAIRLQSACFLSACLILLLSIVTNLVKITQLTNDRSKVYTTVSLQICAVIHNTVLKQGKISGIQARLPESLETDQSIYNQESLGAAEWLSQLSV